MGILKISPRTSRNETLFEQNYDAPIEDVMGREEKSVSKEDSGDDFGASELTEVGSELNMNHGQLFNIPYELYDLPDLRAILSLETWNNCLTEEDRFVLSAYLPDVDQEAFWLTMTELLGGKDLFFDSPLETFFRNLKGGLYHERVTCYTSGLQFLQRIASCYSLRSYHENMIKTFMDMKWLWDACDSSTTVMERIRIWKARNNQSDRVLSLDLNEYPEEEALLSNEISAKASTTPFLKKANSTETKRMPSSISPSVSSVMESIPLNTSRKGLPKIKPPRSNEFHACVPNPAPSSVRVLCRPPPKGVLKVIPKGPASQKAQPMQSAVSSLIEIPVSGTSRFSPSPSSMHKWDTRNSNESSSPLHRVSDKIYHRSPRLPDYVIDRQGVNFVNDTGAPGKALPSSSGHATKYGTSVFSPSSQSHSMSGEISETIPKGDGPSGKARKYTSGSEMCLKNLVQDSKALAIGSVRTHQWDSEYYRVEQNARSTQEQQFVAGSEILREVPTKPQNIGEHSTSAVAPKLNGQSAGLISLPITYKRRKLHTNSLNIMKTPTVEVGNHLGENVKTLKIKFRNWNNESFQSEAGVCMPKESHEEAISKNIWWKRGAQNDREGWFDRVHSVMGICMREDGPIVKDMCRISVGENHHSERELCNYATTAP